MKALENLNKALQEARGRRKAFKMQPIKLDNKQREILQDFPQHYNWKALTDIQAFQITMGGKTQIDAIKVIWVLFGKYNMVHYFTINEFNSLIQNT